MASSSTAQSTLDGLTQLQLKARLLEEDRDYHSNLQRGNEREYVQHKSQLDELCRKQRRIHHERETALTRALAHLQEEASMLRRALDEAMEQQQRTAERIRREEDADREAKEMASRAQLAAVRDEANQKEEELDKLRRELEELRQHRDRKHARVHRLEADHRKLNLQLNANSKNRPTGKVVHPFLPAGPSAKERCGMPTSQNVHSFAQTAQRAAMRTPGADSPLGRRSPARPTRTSLVSSELEKKLKGELRSLYKQCTMLADQLSHVDPNSALDGDDAAVSSTSGRMKAIFAAIDQKQRQLNELRNANIRLSAVDGMDAMNVDADEAKVLSEATHAQLLEVLRSSSFVPE